MQREMNQANWGWSRVSGLALLGQLLPGQPTLPGSPAAPAANSRLREEGRGSVSHGDGDEAAANTADLVLQLKHRHTRSSAPRIYNRGQMLVWFRLFGGSTDTLEQADQLLHHWSNPLQEIKYKAFQQFSGS